MRLGPRHFAASFFCFFVSCGVGLDLPERLTDAAPNTPGGVDSSFGTGGTGFAVVDIGGTDQHTRGLALQSDGKIIVGGTHYDGEKNVFFAARFLSDGKIDESFGEHGFTFNNYPIRVSP